MSTIAAIDPTRTEGKTRENLDAVQKTLGATPNVFRVAAQSPVALEALVHLVTTTGHGTLRARDREAIALAVSEANGCDYCLSAHTALAKGAGLSEAAIDDARSARASEPRLAAILRFAREVARRRGRVDAEALPAVRAAGVSDSEVLEIVANVILHVFTNSINLVAQTDIDFPVVRAHAETP
jgi:uncharacterized peroxidase-related enzyme